MASFTEQATLRVRDQSTAQINRINRALRELQKTARSIRSTTVTIRINQHGIQQAIVNLRRLRNEFNAVKAAARAVNVRINTSGLAQANRQLAQLRAQAARPIVVTTQHRTAGGRGGMGAGGAGGPGNVNPYHQPVQRHGVGYAGARGFTSGLGLSGLAGLGYAVGRTTGSFVAVYGAAYAAAAALKSVAANAAARDRTALQSGIITTPAQRAILDAASERRPETPLPMDMSTRRRLLNSLIGDVSVGPTGTEEDRARAAAVVGRHLEDVIFPRIYGLSPEKDRKAADEGLRMLVKATNLATQSLTEIDTKTGKARISRRAEDVFETAGKAMQIDPEITPEMIRTTLAGLKTSAYTLDKQGLLQAFLNAGARGTKAGNELNQAIRGAQGIVDVKMLNNSLADLGLLENFSRKKATKGQKKGNVITASGRPVDEELLLTDPTAWFMKNYYQKMQERIKQRKDYKTGMENDPVAQAAQVDRDFRGMRQTGQQAIKDMILGNQQLQEQKRQIEASWQQDIPSAIRDSWIAQGENVGAAWSDIAAKVGDNFMKSIGAADFLKGLEQHMRAVEKDPTGPEAMLTYGVGGVIATGTFMILRGITGVLGSIAARIISGAIPAAAGGAAAAGAAAAGGATAAGGAAAAAAAAAGTGTASWLARLGLKVLGPLGILLDSTVPASGTSNLPELEKQRVQQAALNELHRQSAAHEARRAELRREQDTATPQRFNEAATEIAALDAELARLQTTTAAVVQAINAEWEKIQTKTTEPTSLDKSMEELRKTQVPTRDVKWPEVMPPKTVVGQFVDSLFGTAAKQLPQIVVPPELKTAADQIAAGGIPFTQAASTLAAVPADLKSAADQIAVGGVPLVQAAMALAQVQQQPITIPPEFTSIANQIAAGGIPFTQAASSLVSTASSFSGVFEIGANAIGSSGSTAAGHLQAAASGIGATIGQSAAAAINAAVITANINVNNANTGGDTGRQTVK